MRRRAGYTLGFATHFLDLYRACDDVIDSAKLTPSSFSSLLSTRRSTGLLHFRSTAKYQSIVSSKQGRAMAAVVCVSLLCSRETYSSAAVLIRTMTSCFFIPLLGSVGPRTLTRTCPLLYYAIHIILRAARWPAETRTLVVSVSSVVRHGHPVVGPSLTWKTFTYQWPLVPRFHASLNSLGSWF